MREQDFNELVTSIHEAGEVKRGIRKPSRMFVSVRGSSMAMGSAAGVELG